MSEKRRQAIAELCAKEMMVKKRNGKMEVVSFDKILSRVRVMGEMEPKLTGVAYTQLGMKVIEQLCDGITTSKIDELTAEQCHAMYSVHPDYNVLAGRIAVSSHHRNTANSFSKVAKRLYEHKDIRGNDAPLVNKWVYWMVKYHAKELDKLCDYNRDYLIDYFGFKTLERAYLKAVNRVIVERPQHMYLRVAIGIHCTGMKAMEIEAMDSDSHVMRKVRETYDLLSRKKFTHATPTLFNAGTQMQQLSSCFLVAMESDSLDGIFNTLKECAMISKGGGGIGMHISNIRATGSLIRGTDGYSNGIVPMLRVFNNTARYVDQCVFPDTIIYTTKGPKKICDCVSEETEIFGMEGKTEVIQDILEHSYYGKILDIDTANQLYSLKITDKHPVYALNNKTSALEWMDAGDLEEGDMLAYPVPDYSKDNAQMTWVDCYMFGLILGSGHMKNADEYGGYINIATSKRNFTKISEFVKSYFDNRLVEYSILELNDSICIRWNRSVHLPFRYSDLYNEMGEKHIGSKWLYLPLEKSKYILNGLIDVDYNGDKLFIDTSSHILAEACRFLCMKMWALPTGYTKSHITYGESFGTEDELVYKRSYMICIPKTAETCKVLGSDYSVGIEGNFEKVSYRRVGNYLLSPIKSIHVSEYRGVLYDLQMRKEHNYLLSNGLVHNGGGKRKGSFAIYLEPWHADVESFLTMKRNQGNEELKARDLFYALWVPDLFMKRVKSGGQWTLFCPDEAPGLSDVVGDEFERLYENYEREGRGRKTLKAQDMWMQIVDAQMETGNPYLVYKDACNRKSNQQNLGVIKSSNLCTEIVQYSDAQETAVCNLASISLPAFLVDVESGSESSAGINGTGIRFDFNGLREVARVVTYNLNRIIDINEYPSEKASRSNMRHRPIGIGAQGLADVFMRLDMAFTSDAAKELNRQIFETIYLGAVEESIALGALHGAYESFSGSPASRGLLQFDLWDSEAGTGSGATGVAGLMWSTEWAEIKRKLAGGEAVMRNSLLVAPMPTASTSQILGNNECFEPITSNFYIRKTLAGNFVVANRYLMDDLLEIGMWNEKIKNSIIAANGSIQHLDFTGVVSAERAAQIKDKYRTVWEISMKHLIDMSADRGRFVCQSQSLNLWQEKATRTSLTSMHFYAWSRGLKTGLYYLHTLAKHQTQQFTIEPTLKTDAEGEGAVNEVCENCSA
jgi:ribonucleoside-diphosphate reductase alpha subunit